MSVLKPHLYAVRMVVGVGQDLLHYSASPLAGALILLQDDVHLKTGVDIFAILSIHGPGYAVAPGISALRKIPCYGQGREKPKR